MLEHETIEVGAYEVNCTILFENGKAVIVDPGSEGDRIIALLSAKHLEPTAILLTHAHFDHIGAIAALQARWPELPVYVHPADEPAFAHPMNCAPDYPLAPKPANLRDCRSFTLAEVIETPGHTPGGVCYWFKELGLLLSGDTLFAGSVGRTDFPGGDMAELRRSLNRLKALPPETAIIPGHGMFTRLEDELKGNPFLF